MKYLESDSTNPRFNLALEQYVFDKMPKTDEYFMLWQNDNTIVVGKNQNTIGEINKDYVEQEKINVVRRLSGGGAVYHDMGNLNFTFIMDAKGTNELDFELFALPIKESLAELGINAEVSGRNDITIDGRKFSGNAQYMKSGRIMHHGTIMFDSDLSRVASALNVSKDKIESKGVRSVKSRVTTVKEHLSNDISLDEFKKILLNNISKNNKIEKYTLSSDEIKIIEDIQKDRYDKWEWNFGKSPKYSVKKERRVEGVGKIEAYMEVSAGKIADIEFYGDFFGKENANSLKDKLKGVKLQEDSLSEVLNGIKVSDYFHKLTNEEFIGILIG